MRKPTRWLIYALILSFQFNTYAQLDCSEFPDFESLMAIYDATDGPNWRNNEGWQDGADGADCNYCDWPTVGCNENNRVTNLYLNANNLSFTFPPELANLDQLIELRIGENNFDGPIDPIIFSPPNLENISIYDNDYSGTIPEQIGDLTKLRRFVCDRNNLVGPLPANLANCDSLRTFSIAVNKFEGPFPEVLFQLNNLTSLTLNSNLFSGVIPQRFENFPELLNLRIEANEFNGPLPNLSNNPKIDLLLLNHNDFSGEIPEHYANFQLLRTMNLSNNSLSGCIPQSFSNYCPLDLNIRMSSNDGLSHNSNFFSICNGNECDLNDPCYNGIQDGSESGIDCGPDCKPCIEDLPACSEFPDYIPLMQFYDSANGRDWTNHTGWVDGRQGNNCTYCDWEGVSCDENNRVIEINFNINHLTGELSNTLTDLTNLQNLILHRNFISGTIPIEFGLFENLQILNLMNNELFGNIPNSIVDIESLVELYLNENDLTGILPSQIGNLTNLEVFYVHLNELDGELPTSLSEIPGFIRLYLFSNNFTGEIPEEYGYWENMEFFFLDDNDLSGCIPESLSNYCDETVFDLSLNPLLSHNSDVELFCQNPSNCIVSTDDISIPKSEYEIWPNPVRESFRINHISEDGIFITIVDSYGRKLVKTWLNSDEFISITNFIPGNYFAILNFKDGIKTIPFIKI